MDRMPPAIRNILIINVLMFIVAEAVAMKSHVSLQAILGLYYFDSLLFKPWQLVTHFFMHGGIGHILFNMFALYSFGVLLENILGTKRFLIVYFVSALGAVLFQWGLQAWEVHQLTGNITLGGDEQQKLFDHIKELRSQNLTTNLGSIYYTPMVGASGALYGILVAFALFFPNSEMMLLFIPYPVKAKYLVPIIIGLDIYLGLSQYAWDPIAHFAHIGGAVFGGVLVWNWKKKSKFFF